MSKRSCEAAESIEDATLQMARGTVTFLHQEALGELICNGEFEERRLHQEALGKGSTIIISSA